MKNIKIKKRTLLFGIGLSIVALVIIWLRVNNLLPFTSQLMLGGQL